MSDIRVLALSGGVGGARLLRGLQRVVPPGTLAALVNTGDDFEHLGLRISPDIDTALYTLGGLAHPAQGWGRHDETWNFMEVLAAIGGETWFRLGDRDLALHVERTRRLKAGETLTAVTQAFAQRFGIDAKIFPMSDDPVATRVITEEGELAFQDYFVRRQCAPVVRGLRFMGAEKAELSDAARAAFASPELEAIIIAPSNPWLSVDPLLAIPELRDALSSATVPIIAVTPIIAGKAVKGPTAKIMSELGIEVSPVAVAAHYGDLLDGFVLDSRDAVFVDRFRMPVEVADTLMTAPEGSARVAQTALRLASALKIQSVFPQPEGGM
ncbi:MAG TPA: 2-phospho-L-lactate transferase [Rhizomicrobium sp.]|nr:2-phospho-L-lactate transferase [Rhizomicrobium sp.]